MSLFENSQYRWRETYFVLFDAKKRPPLKDVIKALKSLKKRCVLIDPMADENGFVDSLSLISPNDFAALDICYTDGDEVLEQGAVMVDEFKKLGFEGQPPVPWKTIKQYDGRFDVLHFEQIPEEDDDSGDEMLDPSTLLAVMGALAKLTGGVAVDPQSGTFLSDM
jgi:hypothetical protein